MCNISDSVIRIVYNTLRCLASYTYGGVQGRTIGTWLTSMLWHAMISRRKWSKAARWRIHWFTGCVSCYNITCMWECVEWCDSVRRQLSVVCQMGYDCRSFVCMRRHIWNRWKSLWRNTHLRGGTNTLCSDRYYWLVCLVKKGIKLYFSMVIA